MNKTFATFARLRLTLLLGAMLLLTAACGSLPKRADSRASDLEQLQLGVEMLGRQKREPAGSIKHPDEAETNQQLMDVALDLDDALWLSEGDKGLMVEFVQRSVLIIAKSRLNDCAWYGWRCRARQAALLDRLGPREPGPEPGQPRRPDVPAAPPGRAGEARESGPRGEPGD